jgi:hypothetical protein
MRAILTAVIVLWSAAAEAHVELPVIDPTTMCLPPQDVSVCSDLQATAKKAIETSSAPERVITACISEAKSYSAILACIDRMLYVDQMRQIVTTIHANYCEERYPRAERPDDAARCKRREEDARSFISHHAAPFPDAAVATCLARETSYDGFVACIVPASAPAPAG